MTPQVQRIYSLVRKLFTIWLFICCTVSFTFAQEQPLRLSVSKSDITVLVNQNQSFDILWSGQLDQEYSISLIKQHENLVDLDPATFVLSASSPAEQNVNIHGRHPGRLEVTAVSTPNDTRISDSIFVRITVANSEAIIYTSFIFGWIYFGAWSLSFYPQIIVNFKRKSVVGLNFDFVVLNIVGFISYSVFNCCLFWIPAIKEEYSRRHPRGLNPVLLNDVVFSLHAFFATVLVAVQCFMYERGGQRVSRIAGGIISLFVVVIIVSAGLAAGDVVHWLDFLYYCSYIKLTITIIKYVPQALMNYRRKSTSGWSIGNILFDFTGGILSMLQMILNAFNYDDWISIFGDPTKFGLGLFSVLFDILFMLQHYVFYRRQRGLSISNTTTIENLAASDSKTTIADDQVKSV